MNSLPDWKLPSGVSRNAWDHITNADRARQYDDRLAGTPLLQFDLAEAERFFSKAGSLIDIGCGTGRLLLPFSKRGYQVFGVDLSEPMLAVAAEKAKGSQLAIPLAVMNAVEMDAIRAGQFNYAACLFSTFGMVSGAEARRQLLMHVRRILKNGGRFLLHAHNWGFHVWTKSGRRWLWQSLWKSMSGDPAAGDFALPGESGSLEPTLHHFTRREILRDLRRAGFRILEVVPVGLRTDCRLRHAWWFGGIRAYGYLIGAEK
jgi:SAM-dependent methyltransferase